MFGYQNDECGEFDFDLDSIYLISQTREPQV